MSMAGFIVYPACTEYSNAVAPTGGMMLNVIIKFIDAMNRNMIINHIASPPLEE